MKSLKKVKIINWHYFWNETINVEPIVFLTGLNASGKSTLIDALQVILLGDTSGRFFNKAASEKSSRTLKGYLRGELGDADDGGFKYLRNGRFTSYIVLEFYDDLKEKSFSLGAVFDSFDDGSEDHRYFCLEDKIPECEFIKDNIPMEYKTLVAFFNESYKGKFQFMDSNRQYQDLLKKKFGNIKDKYFSLLKKAISFTPITDITTFITEYVCDAQSNIDISSMQENILQYKKLETEAQIMAQRVEKLDEISKTYQNYQTQKSNMGLYSYILERAECENDKNRLNSYLSSVERAQKRLIDIDVDIAEVESNIAELNRRKMRLVQDKASNDTYRLTDELKEQKKNTLEKLASLKRDAMTVKTNLEGYANNFIEVATRLNDAFNAMDKDLLNDDRSYEFKELINAALKVIETSTNLRDNELPHIETLSSETLKEWRDSLDVFKKLISAMSVSLSRTIFSFDKDTALLKQQEAEMRNGGKSYDRALVAIKNELQATLSARHGKEISVDLFADLIDIKNPLWTNAIEGIMHNQKFNIFVDEKYFNEGYEILRDLLAKNHFYGTTLVDQSRIIERNYSADRNSLAEEIITDHEGARAYADFLIGRLVKCKTPVEARNSGNGITPDCDIYRQFALGKLNPRLYTPAYIGRSVGEAQLALKQREIEKNMRLVSTLREFNRIISQANTLEIINTNEIASTLALIEASREIDGLNKNLEYLDRELSNHDITQIESFDKRINDIDIDIKNLENEKSSYVEERGRLMTQIENLQNEKIPDTRKTVEERESHLKDNYDPFFVEDEADPLFKSLIEDGKSTIDIVTEFNGKLSQAQYKAQTVYTLVVKLRKDYIYEYRLSYDAESKDNDAYDNELKEMREVKLPQYQKAITDAYEKATKQFKDDFIARLRTAIESVEVQIDELNVALAQSVFGNDSYRFTCDPSKEYRRYYEMIKDDLLLEIGEDDSKFVEKYQEVMNDLFRQIVDVGERADRSSALQANVAKFTDYRSYLDFDLIVTNKEGDEQHLSKNDQEEEWW